MPHSKQRDPQTIHNLSLCAGRLKKVEGEEKEEKTDPMLEMMQRIRSGNVGLKKVAPPSDPVNKGGVMAEMAKLLVSDWLR